MRKVSSEPSFSKVRYSSPYSIWEEEQSQSQSRGEEREVPQTGVGGRSGLAN